MRGWGLGRHPGEHVERIADRRHRDLRLHRHPHGERTRDAPEIEAGVHPVRVAALLPEQPLQAGVEEAAQDRAHDHDGVVIGDVPGQSHVADPDLGLRRARPVDDHDPATRRVRRRIERHRVAAARRGRSIRRTARRPGPRPGRPRRRRRRGTWPDGGPSSSGYRATSASRSRAGTVSSVPATGRANGELAAYIVAANARSARRRGSARACSRSLIRSSRSRTTSSVGEGRLEHHVGQQIERGRQVPARDLDGPGRGLPAGARLDPRPESLRGLDETDGVVVDGPLGQGLRGEDRHAGARRVLAPCAALEQELPR